MNLPGIETLDLSGKPVLLRGDTDVESENSLRLQVLADTVRTILAKNPDRIIILGTRGRPEGRDMEFSMEPVATMLTNLVGEQVSFVTEVTPETLPDARICLLENLRFEAGEVLNDEQFTQKLASLGDLYVNEAFGISHRKHASIVGLPKLLPHAAGPRMVQEVENLSKVFDNPKRPVIIILSGLKEDKLAYIEPFKNFSDTILVAGRLPEIIEFQGLYENDDKVLIAKLLPDKEDITLHSVEKFEEVIKNAQTIVVGGPIGRFEEEGHRQGTERVFKAVAGSSAFKVAGGGDTEAALKLLRLTEKFDWISVGGGAMLEFLAHKALPGIEALVNNN